MDGSRCLKLMELAKIFIYVFLLLLISAPFRALDSVIAQTSSATSLLVKWSRLPEVYFQGEPLGYIITFYPCGRESDVNIVKVNFTSNTTTLTNLTLDTMYVINVSAVSSGGVGPVNKVKARTDAEGTEVT